MKKSVQCTGFYSVWNDLSGLGKKTKNGTVVQWKYDKIVKNDFSKQRNGSILFYDKKRSL